MREVISVHVGQAGVQIGNACCEYLNSHVLDQRGRRVRSAFFSPSFASGRFLFADQLTTCRGIVHGRTWLERKWIQKLSPVHCSLLLSFTNSLMVVSLKGHRLRTTMASPPSSQKHHPGSMSLVLSTSTWSPMSSMRCEQELTGACSTRRH